jgi:AAHS family 4-hydroxybenzoate transporter-like MFS transporter
MLDESSMSGLQWRVVILCFMVTLLDGFDTQIIAYTGPAIADTFAMSPTDMSYIFIAGTLGMALGAMSLGIIGDRIGRRMAIFGSMVLFGGCSLGIAFAHSPTQVVILRFLAGLGMGGATPVVLAMAAEYSSARLRGAVLTGVLLGLAGGAMIGGLLAAGWLPLLGWRGMYIVGGAIPLVLLAICALALPESVQFLASRGRPDDLLRARGIVGLLTGKTVALDAGFVVPPAIVKGSVKALFGREFRTSTIAIWAIYLFNWIAWFMFLLWLPTVLTQAGLEKPSAALGTVIVNGAFLVYGIPLSIFLPRIDIRRTLGFMCIIGIAICAGLSAVGTNWTMVFVLLAGASFGIGGQQLVLNYVISDTYPTELRATAIGIGRMGAIIGSALGGWMLQAGGISGFYLGLTVPLLIALLSIVLIQPHARHRQQRS